MLAHVDEGSGAPLVFLHGIACDMAHWEPVASLLVRESRCVRMDLPGHGASGGDGADLFVQSAAVHAVVEHLELPPPIMVGHSAGGFTSLIYALTYPTRGVVMVDQPLDVEAFAARVLPLKERLEDADQFSDAFFEFVEFFRTDLVPQERQALLQDHINPRRSVVLKMWEQLLVGEPAEAKAQLEAALPALGVPSLHIYTTEWSDEEAAILELAPHAEAERWGGHGHFVQLEDPGRVADRVRAFARRAGVSW